FWDETEHDKTVKTIGALYGTIEAGKTLDVKASGYVKNNAVRGNVGALDLPSKDRTLAKEAASASALPSIAQASALDISVEDTLGREAIFQPVASPTAPLLIETRSQFIDPTQFLGSDYFLNRIGTDKPEAAMKRFGDGYVDFQLVRSQT